MDTEAIKEIQHYLRTLSFREPRIYPVVVDGIYGKTTADAVRVFQGITGLPPSGDVDPVTWDRLVDAYRKQEQTIVPIAVFPHPNGTIDRNSPSDLVSILQGILQATAVALNRFQPPTISGQYDEQTEESITRFQEISGLPATGVTDLATWNALANVYNDRRFRGNTPKKE